MCLRTEHFGKKLKNLYENKKKVPRTEILSLEPNVGQLPRLKNVSLTLPVYCLRRRLHEFSRYLFPKPGARNFDERVNLFYVIKRT